MKCAGLWMDFARVTCPPEPSLTLMLSLLNLLKEQTDAKEPLYRDANYPLPGSVSRSNIPRGGMIKEQEAGMPMAEVRCSLSPAALYNCTTSVPRCAVIYFFSVDKPTPRSSATCLRVSSLVSAILTASLRNSSILPCPIVRLLCCSKCYQRSGIKPRQVQYQRATKKIPVVLSAEEVARILEAGPGPGLRYRAAFSVAYGGGLRASEVTHLKVGDIDSDRMSTSSYRVVGCHPMGPVGLPAVPGSSCR